MRLRFVLPINPAPEQVTLTAHPAVGWWQTRLTIIRRGEESILTSLLHDNLRYTVEAYVSKHWSLALPCVDYSTSGHYSESGKVVSYLYGRREHKNYVISKDPHAGDIKRWGLCFSQWPKQKRWWDRSWGQAEGSTDLSNCKACLSNCDLSQLDQQAGNCGMKLITPPNCIIFRSANSLRNWRRDRRFNQAIDSRSLAPNRPQRLTSGRRDQHDDDDDDEDGDDDDRQHGERSEHPQERHASSAYRGKLHLCRSGNER